MPARREISAREIGAPVRIASSTVRSFRSFSSGGIAATRAMVEDELYSFRRIERDVFAETLTSRPERCRVASVKLTNWSREASFDAAPEEVR